MHRALAFALSLLAVLALVRLTATAAPSGRALDVTDSGQLLGGRRVSMNSTADQPITMRSDRFIIRRIVVCNRSGTVTSAVGGIYTAPAKGGAALVPNTQVYSALDTAAKFVDLTLAAALSTQVVTTSPLYFSLTTPQGSAGQADVYIIGDDVDRD